MKKRTLKNGGIEYTKSDEETTSKDKLKAVKKPSDLKDSDVKELVYLLAKKNNLI
jgi:hypothetical protein